MIIPLNRGLVPYLPQHSQRPQSKWISAQLFFYIIKENWKEKKKQNEEQLSFRPVIKLRSALKPGSNMSLMFMRSVGSVYPTEDPLRWHLPSSIKQMCALCVGTVPQEWCNVLKLEIHFFSSIKASIQMFYHGLRASLHLCFAVIRSVSQINLSVHLPACPPSQTICMCSHPHTHFFSLFFPSAMRCEDHS